MATASKTAGSSGQTTTPDVVMVAANANKLYTVTGFSITWGDGYITSGATGAFYMWVGNANSSKQVQVSNQTYSSGSSTPSVSWSGSLALNRGDCIRFHCSFSSGGIKNAITLKVTYTETTYTKPAVAAGEIVTKEDMDALKTYLNKGTAVSRGGTITNTIGASYKTGTSVGGAVNASWYNG